jgi:hypothetical protein
MSHKRIAMFATGLAAVLALTVAVASASAFEAHFEHWNVNGSITAKKLNQTITLPTGEFNGVANLEFVPEPGGSGFAASGSVDGTTSVPPFTAPIKLFGLNSEVGLTFTEEGEAKGSITPEVSSDCFAGAEGCELLSVPTKIKIGFTTIGILGLKIPAQCEAKGIELNLADYLTLAKLLGLEAPPGSHFTGTANFPLVFCGGLLGLTEGPLLSALFSGPDNPYSITISPPA